MLRAGVIGLGAMGWGMALNLAAAGVVGIPAVIQIVAEMVQQVVLGSDPCRVALA